MTCDNENRVRRAESFAKRLHAETGCTYDGESFDKHLNRVHDIFSKYFRLLERHLNTSHIDLASILNSRNQPIAIIGEEIETLLSDVECAVWLHDVIEDCRVSYSQLKHEFGEHVADIVYALTNELGKNRGETAERTYPKIRKQGPLAVFVKLCDRIANTEAAYLAAEDSYLEMYRKEYGAFRNFLYREGEWEEMWSYLDKVTEGPIGYLCRNGHERFV
jgi:(p)ppGpp synthase/HD superfamily hydrolase